MAFGVLKPVEGKSPAHKTLFFDLPGNPVAVMVSFYQFVRVALLQLNGANQTQLPLTQAMAETPIRKKPGRTEFQRAILKASQQSGPLAAKAPASCAP
jgi:molybdopterin molybdotransferase